MKQKYLKLTSILLLSSLVLSSCGLSKKTASKVRELTGTNATDSTEDIDDAEPRVVTIESNMYSDAEAPVVVEWDNYQAAEKKENVFERMSEDYMGEFVPSSDYGAVFPFRATYSTVAEADNDDNIHYEYETYGLIDSKGRIICDPVFSDAYRETDILIVSTGYGEEQKYGAINSEGTKFTGIKYDVIRYMYDQDYYYAFGDGKVTFFDSDLNVYTEKTLNVDFYGFDNRDFSLCLDTLAWNGSEPDAEGIWFYRFLDNSHCIGEYDKCWGVKFILDFNTGKLQETEDLFNPDLNICGEHGNKYLADKNGNQLSDYYYEFADGSRLPIFCDAKGNYFGLDSEGNCIYEFEKLDYLQYIPFDEYMLLKTGYSEWTLFDKDFNQIGVYDSTWAIYPNTWDHKFGSILYVVDDGKIIDPLTGEVFMEAVPEADTVYIGNDCIAAYSGAGYVLSNGRELASNQNWCTTVDIVTGKEYMIMTEDHLVMIYDAATDKKIAIEAEVYSDTYYCCIADGNVYFYSYITNSTCLYDFTDVDEPQLLFRYYYTNPLGDD